MGQSVRIYNPYRKAKPKEDPEITSGSLPGLFRYRGHRTGITEGPKLIVRCNRCLTWYNRAHDSGRKLPWTKDGGWEPCIGHVFSEFLERGEKCGEVDYTVYRSFDFEAMPIGRIILPRKEVIKTPED